MRACSTCRASSSRSRSGSSSRTSCCPRSGRSTPSSASVRAAVVHGRVWTNERVDRYAPNHYDIQDGSRRLPTNATRRPTRKQPTICTCKSPPFRRAGLPAGVLRLQVPHRERLLQREPAREHYSAIVYMPTVVFVFCWWMDTCVCICMCTSMHRPPDHGLRHTAIKQNHNLDPSTARPTWIQRPAPAPTSLKNRTRSSRWGPAPRARRSSASSSAPSSASTCVLHCAPPAGRSMG